MQLSALVDAGDARLASGSGAVEIRGLAADSRRCGRGFLFAALPGSRTDGRRFIADAAARGSVAVLTGEDGLSSLDAAGLAVVGARQPRRSFSLMCARYFERRPRVCVGVTGTNGKSSTVEFCRQFWRALGHDGAAMGTLGVVGPEDGEALAHTTPDPVTLHARLRELSDRGIDRVAIEASSHGLDQRRLDGVAFRAAGFTNLTRDHLDYHPTVEAYLEAKARLFDLAPPGGAAVLNADVPEFAALAARGRDRGLAVVSYGASGSGLRLTARRSSGDGRQRLSVAADGRDIDIELSLAGRFQAMNVLCAAAMIAAVEQCPAAEVLAHAGMLTGVRGRLEAVPGHPGGARVYVDYAHTPDALENVLAALRPEIEGRLVVVFGCGGDRDRAKRPLMGAIARRLADDVIVTDDNPRTEDPAAIRREIRAGAPDAREVADRRGAIESAAASLARGDVLVIAGKGHERGQVVGDTTLPFDDAAEARRVLANLGGGP